MASQRKDVFMVEYEERYINLNNSYGALNPRGYTFTRLCNSDAC